MERNYILFIDSGIGGLSTLKTALKMIKANIIYYADNLHAPYGKHNKDEIFEYLKNIISLNLEKYKIKLVVLACNTATTSSIKSLRAYFKNITFIGTEPAIMLAKTLNFKNIACIATKTTIEQYKYEELCIKSNAHITSIPLPNFATAIENYFTSPTIYNKLEIIKTIFYIKSMLTDCDCLVLGCTHYVLIKEILKSYINIPLIDGNIGTCKMIEKLSKKSSKSTYKLCFSNYNPELKRKYIKILKQTLAKL